MFTFMKGKRPDLIVASAPLDGSEFTEEAFALAYDRFGGFYVCTCTPEVRDGLLFRLNSHEQVHALAEAFAQGCLCV